MLTYVPVKLGGDPELFLTRNGKVIGSDVVVPPGGLQFMMGGYPYTNKPLLVRDGVQAEMQPQPATCRAQVGGSLAKCFQALQQAMKDGITPSFEPVVELSEEDFAALSDDSKLLGCMPSFNNYDPAAVPGVDGAVYRKRSAGGHVHIGMTQMPDNMGHGYLWTEKCVEFYKRRVRMVPLLDILLGNTSVLLDRHPHAAVRRQVYGRAGEYRLPEHGLEYRVLSNFWLRAYPLMGLVLGLARTAAAVLWTDLWAGHRVYDQSVHARQFLPQTDPRYMNDLYRTIPQKQNLEGELLSMVDLSQVVQAINTNDFDLAWANYQRIKPWIMEHVEANNGDHGFPLHQENLDLFERVVQEGMDAWFFEDPLQHWVEQGTIGGKVGWEKFLQQMVKYVVKREEYLKSKEVQSGS